MSSYRTALRRRVRAAQGNACAICGEAFGSIRPTFEHVLPRSMGGRTKRNVVLTHERCNRMRGSAAPTGCLLIILDAVNTRLAA